MDLVLHAQQFALGYSTVVENEVVLRIEAKSHLVVQAADLEPLLWRKEHESRGPLRPGNGFVRAREYRHEFRLGPHGDELLGSVKEVIAALALGGEPGPRRQRSAIGERIVASRVRLGDPDADAVAGVLEETGNHAFDLFLRGDSHQPEEGLPVVAVYLRDRRLARRKLLDHDALGQDIGSAATVFLGDGQRVEAQLRAALDQLPRKRVLAVRKAVEFGALRDKLVAGESPGQVPNRALLLGQTEIHTNSP